MDNYPFDEDEGPNGTWVFDEKKSEEFVTKGDLFLVANRGLMLSGRIYQALLAMRGNDEAERDEALDRVSALLVEHAQLVDDLIGGYERGE